MPRLVGIVNGEMVVAHRYIATPAYTLYVADYADGTLPPEGWTYYAEDVTLADLTLPWVRPVDPQSAYALGAFVLHADCKWTSAINSNAWEPGVFGWVQQ